MWSGLLRAAHSSGEIVCRLQQRLDYVSNPMRVSAAPRKRHCHPQVKFVETSGQRIFTQDRIAGDRHHPQNCTFSWWGSTLPHLIRGFLDPFEYPAQTVSRSVHPFLHDSRLSPRDRHTDRGTSVTIGRISASFHSVHVMRPNNTLLSITHQLRC